LIKPLAAHPQRFRGALLILLAPVQRIEDHPLLQFGDGLLHGEPGGEDGGSAAAVPDGFGQIRAYS